MKAIILAAGYGNRMRPLTDTKHKTLLTVGGATIIGRIIDVLLDNRIEDIIVVTGYRAEELQEWLTAHYPKATFTFVHNPRFRQTNNIYSMALAFESADIRDDIILIESDLIFHPSIIRKLLSSPHSDVALVDHYRSGMDGTVVKVEDGVITSVIPPHLQGENFDFSNTFKTLNIYKFSQRLCETSLGKLLTWYARTIDDNCYYELILGILIYMQKETIHAEIVDGEQWAEVDDPNDLSVAEFTFNVDRLKILQSSQGGYWNYDITDFCFIRNMYFPSHSMISEIRNNLPNLLHNYGSTQRILDRKMSWFLTCDEKDVIALNGLSQVYPILRTYWNSSKVLIPHPTFGEYPRMFPTAEHYSDEIGYDKNEIDSKAGKSDIVVFVNPNNPSGSSLQVQWIFDWSAAHPDITIFVDESFVEFSSCGSIIPLLMKFPLNNVIVGKSLSKSLGVPGIRLGYVFSSNDKLKSFIREQIPVWNMNSIAEFYMEILLKNRNELDRSIKKTVDDRDKFAKDLSEVPIVESVFSEGGNFILARLAQNAPHADRIVNDMLSKYKILIKNISSKYTSSRQYLRFAVRLPEENSNCVKQLLSLSY